MSPIDSSKSTTSSGAAQQQQLQQSLTELIQKVEASLQPKIDEQRVAGQQEREGGLDFLDAKNGLLLSYLIELTFHLRSHLVLLMQQDGASESQQQQQQERFAQSLHRLTVMRTCLDKLRGLDKKLRYQIDKLLAHAASSNSGSAQFATATATEEEEEDPLQFRPAVEDSNDEDADGDSSSGSSSEDEDDDEEDRKVSSKKKQQREDKAESEEAEEDLDDDLAAARRTMALASVKRKTSNRNDDSDDGDGGGGGVYRAPRMAAVPYTHDVQDRRAARERRHRRQLRASEVAQALRQQYGDAPERDDAAGGAGVGRQREAARRLAERERQRTEFEEDNMIRLATPRAEKKERKRLMREETSNLAAISDLGSLARGSNVAGRHRRSQQDGDGDGFGDGDFRHSNGKRRRQVMDRDGRVQGKSERKPKAQNALQAALFGGGSGGKSKKRKSKR